MSLWTQANLNPKAISVSPSACHIAGPPKRLYAERTNLVPDRTTAKSPRCVWWLPAVSQAPRYVTHHSNLQRGFNLHVTSLNRLRFGLITQFFHLSLFLPQFYKVYIFSLLVFIFQHPHTYYQRRNFICLSQMPTEVTINNRCSINIWIVYIVGLLRLSLNWWCGTQSPLLSTYYMLGTAHLLHATY